MKTSELKLNIYQNGEVEKTYTADQYDIMFGTIEDLTELIEPDVFTDVKDSEFVAACAKVISNGMYQVRNLLKEIFPEVTEDELRRVKVKELVPLIMEIVKYTIGEMGRVSTGKN